MRTSEVDVDTEGGEGEGELTRPRPRPRTGCFSRVTLRIYLPAMPESATERYSTQSWNRAIHYTSADTRISCLNCDMEGNKFSRGIQVIQIFTRRLGRGLLAEVKTKEVVWKLGVLVPSWHSWQVSGSEVGTDGRVMGM